MRAAFAALVFGGTDEAAPLKTWQAWMRMPTVDDPMPDLMRTLRSPQADVRCRSAKALGRLGWLAKDALPGLVQCLRDNDPAVREAAAQAVGLMGPEALPHLCAMLGHADKYVRRNAVWALGKLGPLALPAVAPLCQALRDADPRTASGAAQALGNMQGDAAEAIPALTEAMRGTNIVLCRLAAKALSEIGRPALPALLAHLRHRDPFVRGEAALAIGWIGPAATAAVPALCDVLMPAGTTPPPRGALDSTPPFGTPVATSAPAPKVDDTCRAYAAQALGRIGPAAASALPTLADAARDECEVVRQSAQLALKLVRGESGER